MLTQSSSLRTEPHANDTITSDDLLPTWPQSSIRGHQMPHRGGGASVSNYQEQSDTRQPELEDEAITRPSLWHVHKTSGFYSKTH